MYKKKKNALDCCMVLFLGISEPVATQGAVRSARDGK